MLIKNNTSLDYESIGILIDKIQKETYGATLYEGLLQACKIKWYEKTIKIQIRYLKRYVEWYFEELKDSDTKE